MGKWPGWGHVLNCDERVLVPHFKEMKALFRMAGNVGSVPAVAL